MPIIGFRVEKRTSDEGFQSNIDSDKRFNSTNIRKVVVEAGLDRTRDDRRKEKLAREQQMTTLEKNLTEIETGLTRVNSGYIQLKGIVNAMGGLNSTDFTSVVNLKLNKIAENIRRLESLLKTKDVRNILMVEKI